MPGVYQKLYDTASGILPPFPNKASGPQRLQVFILENTEKWLQRNTVKTEKKEIPRWLLVSFSLALAALMKDGNHLCKYWEKIGCGSGN